MADDAIAPISSGTPAEVVGHQQPGSRPAVKRRKPKDERKNKPDHDAQQEQGVDLYA